MLSYFTTSPAVIVTGLYEAEVPVLDQSVQSRKKNMSAALRIVLIKLTGNQDIFAHTEIVHLLFNADQYTQKFEYRTTQHGDSVLWVRFNKYMVDELLYQQATSRWGRERPSTLVWLAVDDASGRRFIALNDETLYLETMEKVATRRGIILLHPLFDLEDRKQVQISDIWGNFHEIVQSASLRYQADLTLTVRLENIAPEQWRARWVIYTDNEMISWETEAQLAEKALSQGVNKLADKLAAQYGRVDDNIHQNETEILVNGIVNYDKYAKVLNYLKSLNAVSKVAVIEVNKDSVRYVLTVQRDITIVPTSINLGEMLEQTDTHSYQLLR